MGPLNRYGWWKRQDGAPCHQDRLIRQQLIEQLTREILNYDAEFRRLWRSPLHGEIQRRSALSAASNAQLGRARSSMSPARPNAVHEMLSRPLRLLAETRHHNLGFRASAVRSVAGGSSYPDGRWRRRSHGFTRPTTRRGAECAPSTVKPLYLQTYFRLAASGSRGKAVADNQSLRLHRPQAPVSPTVAS